MTFHSTCLTAGFCSVLVASGVLLSGCGGGSSGGSGGSGSSDATGARGVIDIAGGSRVDSDYADLWRANGGDWPSGSGGTVPLPVPAVAGGYLSHASGVYEPIGFPFPEDESDQYQVHLEDGDRYFLQCFSSAGEDTDSLDVSLALDDSQEFDGDACGSGGTMSGSGDVTITVSTAGGGPFRYVLSIASRGALTASDASWPEPPLRVDEAIVNGPAAVANALSSSGLRASSVMSMERSIGPDTWHVTREAGASARSVGAVGGGDPRAETVEWIRGMRDEFGLQVEPNYLFNLSTPTGQNPYYHGSREGKPDNWNLEQINVPAAWGLLDSWGQGVGIAVMDTGMFSVTPDSYDDWHEDLVNNIVDQDGQLDFVSRDYDVDETEGRDNVPGTPPTPGNPGATSFHGTHVAGIIAAEDNSVGTVGIAYQSTILPYRVLGVDPVDGEDGTGALSDLVAAINDAADRNGDERKDVDVINLSLGGLPQVDSLQSATNRAYDAGVLIVAAGGNSGNASAVYPAANYRVLGVGATDSSGTLASYSNFGVSVDLLAPGGGLDEGIVNAYGTVSSGDTLSDSYAYLGGTSMAVPHVTGVYALMKDTVEGITPDQFRAQLIAGLLTDGDNGNLNDFALYGAGLLDAEQALDPVTRNDFPTVVSAWPRVLEVSPSGSESTVLLEVLKEDAANNPYVDGDPVVPEPFVLTDGDGQPVVTGDPIPERLQVRADPAQLPDTRDVSRDIVIGYTNGTTTAELVVPVHVQSTDQQGQRNAGRHYVLLLDADDYDSDRSRQVSASYDDGQYRFSVTGIAPGEYILVAGTDLDNNGYICESGEACAEYPETGRRQVITIREGQTPRLDMTTSFHRPTIAEMGLPRYGFRGYPIPGRQVGDEPDRALAQ